MWVRNCPNCNRRIHYLHQSNYCRGVRTNAKCSFCAHDGQLIGRIQSAEEKELRAASCRGKVRSIASRRRYADSKRGEKNPRYNDHTPKSSEHRRKIRLGCIKALEERLRFAGTPLNPAFNLIACKSIDRILKQNGLFIYRFWEHEINKSVEQCINRVKLN